MKYSYLATILLLFLLGCRGKELDFALPYSGDKLVIWGKLEAGKPIRIQVGRSFNPIGKIPDDITMNGAQVVLFKNGKEYITVLPSAEGGGVYVSDSLIEAGASYMVKVSATNFPTAESAEVPVPMRPPAFTYTVQKNAPRIVNVDREQDLISLYAPEQERNIGKYFLLSFLCYYPDRTVATNWPAADNVVANEEDCYTWASDRVGSRQSLFLFSSDCLPPTAVPLKFSIETMEGAFKLDSFYYMRPFKIEMKLGTISKEIFTFAKVEWKQPQGLDNLVLAARSTYGNVKNGYGLVYATNEISIELK